MRGYSQLAMGNMSVLKLFKIIACGLSIFLSDTIAAQVISSDSLKDIIKTLPRDSTCVIKLNELSNRLWDTKPDQAISLATEAKDLGNLINYKTGVAYALKNIGLAYYIKGEYINVLDYWQQSLAVFDSIGDKTGVSNILNNLGAVFFNQGDDAKAIEYNLKSLRIAEEIGDKLRIASVYLNIGNVYLNKTETHDKALDYLTRGLILSEELEDRKAIGNVSVNIGEIYYLRDQFDSALYYFNKSLKAYENDDNGNAAYPLNSIGKVNSKRGQYASAIINHNQAYEISKQIDDDLQMAQSLIGIGNAYRYSKRFEMALDPYKKAELHSNKIEALQELQEIYEGLSLSYSQIRDYTNALKYQVLLTKINFNIYNAENDKKIERLTFSHEIDKKQDEINLLTKEKSIQQLEIKRQQQAKYSYMAGAILLLIIAFITYRNYRSKVKTNQLLDHHNEEIETLLLNILPKETAKELQKDGYATPRSYNSVSVLFTDFKDFTKIAEGLKPHELVAELNSFFNAFDDIIEKFHLEKIKTIGDSYMCAGGIPAANATHPGRIVKAGLAMQEFMINKNELRAKQKLQPWELRVGIHTGPIVAGVVGKKKYAYDIWGDTVNIASRMESNGKVGKVNISSATYELVKDSFQCAYRGKIEAKNKGLVTMYFVEKENDKISLSA